MVTWKEMERSLRPVPETVCYCSVVLVEHGAEQWLFVRPGKPWTDTPADRRLAELLGLPTDPAGWSAEWRDNGTCEWSQEILPLLESLHEWTRARWWLCDLYAQMRPGDPLPKGGRWVEEHAGRRAG